MDDILNKLDKFPSKFRIEINDAYLNCECIKHISSWLVRFKKLTNGIENKSKVYRQLEDHIFELKVMNYLINSFPGCKIIYEPKGTVLKGKNCDLDIRYQNRRYLVEIKCFHPDQKSKSVPKKHISKGNIVLMDNDIYHSYQATRGHLLDITYQSEEKFKNYNGNFISVLAVPDGFYLDIEDFRDFVYIYRKNEPRADDPLGKMTMHEMSSSFEGIINQFWAFPFPQCSFSLKEGKDVKVVAPLSVDDIKLKL